MNELNMLIEQMALDIAAQAYQLDDLRLRMFLNWLMDHSSEMKVSIEKCDTGQERFKSALTTWLQSLPAQGLLWEYQTIMAEIGWWRDLDPCRLTTIVRSEAGG